MTSWSTWSRAKRRRPRRWPSGPPTLLGTPTVGSQLACVNGGFQNAPTSLSYAWLRNGAVVAGATAPTYTLTAADLGRSVACRITATNAHGSGDATSEALIVSNPAPAFTATPQPATVAGPTTTTTTATSKSAGVTYKATCKLAKSKKAIACTVASSSKSTKFTAKVRLQSKGTAATSKASKSGKLKLTLKSRKALKKGQKVVLSVKSGKTTTVFTAKAS